MNSRLSVSALMLCVALSSAAAQQQAGSPDPLSKLDIQSLAIVRGIIDSAKNEGLPWNSLRLKAIEGINKKYKNKAIIEALRTYYRRLELSRAALGPLATEEEIEAGASVLAADVSAEDLGRFRVVARPRSPSVALTYLADLIDKHQVPRKDALEAFGKLWKDGAADSDFEGLWRGVDQDILGGVSPQAALQSRMRSLPPRKPPVGQEMENPRS